MGQTDVVLHEITTVDSSPQAARVNDRGLFPFCTAQNGYYDNRSINILCD